MALVKRFFSFSKNNESRRPSTIATHQISYPQPTEFQSINNAAISHPAIYHPRPAGPMKNTSYGMDTKRSARSPATTDPNFAHHEAEAEWKAAYSKFPLPKRSTCPVASPIILDGDIHPAYRKIHEPSPPPLPPRPQTTESGPDNSSPVAPTSKRESDASTLFTDAEIGITIMTEEFDVLGKKFAVRQPRFDWVTDRRVVCFARRCTREFKKDGQTKTIDGKMLIIDTFAFKGS